MTHRDTAMRILAVREHSCHELRCKLKKRGYDSEEVAALLETLQNEGLLSDQRFAEAYTRSRALRGEGPERIRAGLINRSVSEEIVLSSLAHCGINWVDLAVKVLRKKFGAQALEQTIDFVKKQRFLYYRGFSAEIINRVWCEVD